MMWEMFVALCLTALIFFGYFCGHTDVMREAFERGYSVQCTGKLGYHWDCKK